MSRLIFTLLLIFSLRLSAAERPNVLFFFADDQRADTIAALGNTVIQTPVLDGLVRRGLTFDRAYMQGGMNAATCVPSRAMLLSGRSLFRADEKLMRDETWPAAFGRAGYTTFISGKWHNSPQSITRSFQVARSMFTGGMTNPMTAPLASVVNGKLEKPKPTTRHGCAVFADEAIRFIGEKHDAPFFCYVPFDGPHDPHIVPDDFPVKYDPEKIPLPANFLPVHPFDNGEMTVRDEKLLPTPRAEADIRAMLADYYRYISFLDEQMGRVLAALESTPAAKNTIVVFAADSGVGRGSHGLIGKQNCYEHSMRVPLVIAGPGIPADRRTGAMCYLYDLLPTLGKICAVPAPATSEGMDLGPVLADPSKPGRAEIFLAYQRVQRALRDDRWKLIDYPQIKRTQLFDLQTDPDEKHDLSALPERAGELARLRERLAKMQAELSDPLVKPGK